MSIHHKVRVKTSHEAEFVGEGAGLLSIELGVVPQLCEPHILSHMSRKCMFF